MNLTPYVFQYAKVPAEVAVTLSLGYRRRLSDGCIIINQTEAQPLPGETFVDKITTVQGVVLTNAEAKELLKTSVKSLEKTIEITDPEEVVIPDEGGDTDAVVDTEIPESPIEEPIEEITEEDNV